uniref:Uncharacterized protein n=1 Tax=Anguilla anguilla TaxID=7936 RepID=A0A0E9SPR5_ANGAN
MVCEMSRSSLIHVFATKPLVIHSLPGKRSSYNQPGFVSGGCGLCGTCPGELMILEKGQLLWYNLYLGPMPAGTLAVKWI